MSGGPPAKMYPVRYDSASTVRWTSDGKALLFNGGVADHANVRRQPLDGGFSVKLTNFSHAIVFDFEESTDGKALLVTRVNLIRDAVLISGFD